MHKAKGRTLCIEPLTLLCSLFCFEVLYFFLKNTVLRWFFAAALQQEGYGLDSGLQAFSVRSWGANYEVIHESLVD